MKLPCNTLAKGKTIVLCNYESIKYQLISDFY